MGCRSLCSVMAGAGLTLFLFASALRAENAHVRGQVHAWGLQASGQTSIPIAIESETIKEIAAGGSFSLALTDDGRVYAWGAEDHYGQLYELAVVPDSVSSETTDAIAAGYQHSLAVSDEGRVYSWGLDIHGTLPVPAAIQILSNLTAASAGRSHSLVLTGSGSVLIWGEDNWNLQDDRPGGAGFKAIASGGYHCLAIKSDDTVYAWGHDQYGQNVVPVAYRDLPVIAIAAGEYHSVAVTADGNFIGWGNDQYGCTTWPSGMESLDGHVVDVAAGDRLTVVLLDDGSVRAWGYNYNEQADVPDYLSDKNHHDFVPAIDISTSFRHVLALTMPQVAKPSIDTESFGTQVNVTLSCATDEALIYYTLNGNEPTVEDGEPYFDTFAVIESATLKARAFKAPDYYPSVVLTRDLVIERPEIAVSDIDFEDVEVGATATGQLLIQNTGSLDAEITDIHSIIPAFQVDIDDPISLEAGEEVALDITFSPTVVDNYLAVLEIESDAVIQGKVRGCEAEVCLYLPSSALMADQ
jgi:hypothetical protein